MLLYRTPDGLGYNPLSFNSRNRNFDSNTQKVYLFMLTTRSTIYSAVISSLFLANSGVFLLLANHFAPPGGPRWLYAYFGVAILLFMIRGTMFRDVRRYSLAETKMCGTAPAVFAFEWLAIFLSMAFTYVLLSLRLDMGFGFYSDAVLGVFLILALLPFALLALAKLRMSGDT